MTRQFLLPATLALLLAPLPASATPAHELSGLYKATAGSATFYLQVNRKKGGGYQGQVFAPGDAGGLNENGNTLAITVSGDKIDCSFDKRPGHFSASTDGDSLAGTWQVSGPAAPLTFTRVPKDTVIDPAPHTTRMIAVDKGVTLEVLDFGGSGPALVFLTGLGDDAHVFDAFAPRFTARHHVYAITRRGFGISSIPAPNAQNYDANRLGDDVVAVLDKLKLEHPVLAGHSISGEELSAVEVDHPGRVAGLIYMDAGYGYALYTPGGQIAFGSNITSQSKVVEAGLQRLESVAHDPDALAAAITETLKQLADLQTDLKSTQESMAAGYAILAPRPNATLSSKLVKAMLDGARRYDHVGGPILAFYASPPAVPPGTPDAVKPVIQHAGDYVVTQINAFAAANPQAHIVRLPNAPHYIYKSNADEVEREMNAFMDGLPR